MITLPITVTPDNLPALDLIWLKIGCRIVWEQGPDRMEIDDTPSHGLECGQSARLLVNPESLEMLLDWAYMHNRTELPALLLMYQAAEQVEQDERAADRGQWGRNA